MSQRRILFLIRTPPYGTALAQEALDAMLVAGVFEQRVSVLFLDDGVYQLLASQRGRLLETRDIARALAALPVYDVERIFVAAQSLRSRGLEGEELALPAQPLEASAIAALIGEQDTVLSA